MLCRPDHLGPERDSICLRSEGPEKYMEVEGVKQGRSYRDA
jgi:hypothetical protein